MRHEWCKSVFAGDYYGAKHPMRQTRTWELLAGGGKWHWILQLYSWPYYAMIIAGLVLAGFSAFLWPLIKSIGKRRKNWGIYRDIFSGKAGFPAKVWYNDDIHGRLHPLGIPGAAGSQN